MGEQKPENGQDPNSPKDQYEELKGQVDEGGVPKHPEERAEYYKTKFGESTKGVQELLTKNQNLARENEDLKKPKFTQDELSTLIPGYNQLAPEQQKAIFESWSNMQRDLDGLKNSVASIADRQAFEDGFKNLVRMEEFSVLKKHKDLFKAYAYSDEYKDIDDLSIIARSYIMEKKLYTPGEQAPVEPKEPERPGLDTTRGGFKPSNKEEGFTQEEVAAMRTSDPQKYNRLAAAGKLKVKD